jgi:nucleoside-diphosphate-sugar epimerase
MIYVTGANGLIGTKFCEIYKGPIKKVSYRDEVKDVFESHEKSCLIHLAWSSTTRTNYSCLEESLKNDVINSKKLFDYYLQKNPNGKIIFLSSAGDFYKGYERTVTEEMPPKPTTLYGETKLLVENILKDLDCDTVTFRVSNVWGAKCIKDTRINGLVDKLIKNLNTDNVTEIYTNLDTRVDIIHIDDLVDLILKCLEKENIIKHQMFIVGSQSLTIKEIISIICSNGSLLLKFNQKELKTYLHVENSRVCKNFDWFPRHKLI